MRASVRHTTPTTPLELLPLLNLGLSSSDIPRDLRPFPLFLVVLAAHHAANERADHPQEQAPPQTSPEAHLSRPFA